jgi:transcriptional regulator with XRE-family HTH domain
MSSGKSQSLRRSIRGPVSLALAGIIRELRQQRHWTLGKLAEKSGLSRHGLFFVENRNGSLLTDTVERVGKALGVKYSRLVILAEVRAATWPPKCADCNYSCIEFGRLKDLDSNRGCIRPAH